MFLWRADTLANALREHLPNTAPLLEKIAAAYGTRKFGTPSASYTRNAKTSASTMLSSNPARPKEKTSRASSACHPTLDGTTSAPGPRCTSTTYRKAKPGGGSPASASGSFALNATNNYVHAPGKFVALVGVSNLVIVETEDALLVTTLDQSQDVGKVVKHLDEKRLSKLV
jgi:mannose-1-phosphate guanylyltransferase